MSLKSAAQLWALLTEFSFDQTTPHVVTNGFLAHLFYNECKKRYPETITKIKVLTGLGVKNGVMRSKLVSLHDFITKKLRHLNSGDAWETLMKELKRSYTIPKELPTSISSLPLDEKVGSLPLASSTPQKPKEKICVLRNDCRGCVSSKNLISMEEKITKLIDKVEKISEQNDRLELELLRCQEEIVGLKKGKLELKSALNSKSREVEELKTRIDQLVTVEHSSPDTVKEIVKNMTADGLKRIDQLETKVNDLCNQVTNGANRQDEGEKRLTILHKLFNTLYSADKLETTQEQAQHERMDHPLPWSTSGVGGSAVIPTPYGQYPTHHRMEIIRQSRFDVRYMVMSPKPVPPLKTGEAVVIKDYTGGLILNCALMDISSGMYTCGAYGVYHFRSGWIQDGTGEVRGYICSYCACNGYDRKRRLLIMTTTKEKDGGGEVKTIRWLCDVGEKVWIDVERVSGDAKLHTVGFSGILDD